MPRLPLIALLLHALLLVPGSADDLAPLPAPAWKLRPEVQVDSAGLFQDQLFALETTSTPLQRTRLADPPSPGQVLTLSGDQILSLLRQHNPDFAGPLTGAPQVRITRRTRTLPEPELLELLTATLQRDHVRDRGDLELRLARPWPPTPIPDEPFVLKVTDLPTLGVTPHFVVRFELLGSRERFADCQAVVQARVYREVLIARSSLKRGLPLARADLLLDRRDVLPLREPLEAAARFDDSLELTENVSPGSPLTTRSVRSRPVVRRGQLLDAVIQDGALNITLKVEVLEDGQAGQTVRVRNPLSRRELSGKVMNETTLLLSL